MLLTDLRLQYLLLSFEILIRKIRKAIGYGSKRLIKQKFKDRSTGHLYAELKTILEHWNVSWTKQHNNRAVLLNLMDKEQNRRNLKDSDVIRMMYYTRKNTIH